MIEWKVRRCRGTKVPRLQKIAECYSEELKTPQKIYDLMSNVYELDNQIEEYVYLLAVNNNMDVLGIFEVSHGGFNFSYITPKEVFIRALLCAAPSIVLVHNHPSGNTHPSKEDIQFTEQIKKAGEILSVQLLDHIIVGNGYFSFKEEGYL